MTSTLSKYWRAIGPLGNPQGSMKSCTRQASVSWLGAGRHTKGAITTQGLAPENAACVPGRAPKWARGTHPPELIAAAHAESFSMTLANELWKAGYPAHQIDTT